MLEKVITVCMDLNKESLLQSRVTVKKSVKMASFFSDFISLFSISCSENRDFSKGKRIADQKAGF